VSGVAPPLVTMHRLLVLLVAPLVAASALAGASQAAGPVSDATAEAPEATARASASASTSTQATDGLEAGVELDAGTSELMLATDLPDPRASSDLTGEAGGGPEDEGDAEASAQAQAEDEGGEAGSTTPTSLPEPRATHAAAGVAAATLTAYAALRWRYLLGLVPLYSRLSKGELLENEVRAELVDLIEENPGMAQGELCEAVGAGWGNTTYHLQRLEQAGFVRSEKQGHHRRFYRAGEVEGEEIEALGVLKNDNAQRIARYLVEEPGANQKQMCEALDMSPSLAHKWISRLEENDLVESEREWRSKHYEPDERLPELVEAV